MSSTLLPPEERINAELHGHRLQPSHVVGTMTLLLIAGIDDHASVVTWSAGQIRDPRTLPLRIR